MDKAYILSDLRTINLRMGMDYATSATAVTENGAATGATAGKIRQRIRSSIACKMCHARRVKCNAAEKMPCANCERARCECRLIESKRGRKKRLTPITPTPDDFPTSSPANGDYLPPRDRDRLRLVVPEATVGNPIGEVRSPLAASPGPENLYAQVLENAVSHSTPGRHFAKPGGQVVYLGETFNLTYLLQQTNLKSPQDAHKLHYLLPIDLKSSTKQRRDEDTATLELLGQQGAFLIPPTETCLELFRVYFKHVHPHYPILDRREFATRYANPTSPPSYLLLQAVFFMAAGHCDISLLHNAGFKSRYEARLTLFKRTKALYDADHETDKVTIVQALFLMSFWWNSPTDQKDTWHWLGSSISLAFTLGMHRSTRHSDMSMRDQRLWKKIWWSLYTEDKHAAAALGRPVHIRLKDCDVGPLKEADFHEEPCPDEHIYGFQERIDVLYVLALSSLAKIVERIIEKSFNAHDSRLSSQIDSLESCEELLRDWEAHLPAELQLGRCGDSIWTSMLHIAHCWFRIMTHRSRTLEDPSTPARRSSHKIAMASADRVVRILEDVLSTSQIYHCPIHIIPALFAAMGMHAVNICSGDAVLEQLGYVKIRMSMIALRELQNTWPVSGWILILFTKMVRRIRDRDDTPSHESSRATPSDFRRNTIDSAVQADSDRMSITQDNTHTPRSVRQSAPNFSYPSRFHATSDVSFAAWDSQKAAVPLNFAMDWSGVVDGDFWSDPEFDFLAGTPLTTARPPSL